MDAKQNLKDTLSDIWQIQHIKVERDHCIKDKNWSSSRTILVKLSSFKIKECIVIEAKKRKVYEDFSKDTVETLIGKIVK